MEVRLQTALKCIADTVLGPTCNITIAELISPHPRNEPVDGDATDIMLLEDHTSESVPSAPMDEGNSG